MAERKVQLHALPASYNGRCKDGKVDVDYIQTNLSVPSVRITKKAGDKTITELVRISPDATLHKFEFRLPIPKVADVKADKFCGDNFNMTAQQIMREGILRMATTVDDQAKSVLCEGIDHPDNADKITGAQHLKAQAVFDDWRWTERAARGKSAGVAEMAAKLVGLGLITQEMADEIETKADLYAVLETLKKKGK